MIRLIDFDVVWRKQHHAMAMSGGWRERWCALLLLLCCFVSLSHGVMEESSFVVSRHTGEVNGVIVGHDAKPCGSEVRAMLKFESPFCDECSEGKIFLFVCVPTVS